MSAFAGLAVTVRRLEHRRESFVNSFEFAAAVLLVVASGSLQTGQLSVLIVACWLLFLGASARGRPILAGSALALPAALKFYPALLVMVPLLMRARRQVVAFAVATPLLLIIPPHCITVIQTPQNCGRHTGTTVFWGKGISTLCAGD